LTLFEQPHAVAAAVAAAAAAVDLTGTGHDQAVSLNSMLSGGGWFSKMSGGKPVRAIISPLTRWATTAPTAQRRLCAPEQFWCQMVPSHICRGCCSAAQITAPHSRLLVHVRCYSIVLWSVTSCLCGLQCMTTAAAAAAAVGHQVPAHSHRGHEGPCCQRDQH
jgi:hypothetical protein